MEVACTALVAVDVAAGPAAVDEVVSIVREPVSVGLDNYKTFSFRVVRVVWNRGTERSCRARCGSHRVDPRAKQV